MKITRCLRTLQSGIIYKRDLMKYKKACKLTGETKFIYNAKNRMVMLKDRYMAAGRVDGHYFFQDIFMAKEVFKASPEKHFDIASRLDGFIAHLLVCGIDVTMIDIRPLPFSIEGCNFIQGDVMDLCGKGIESESIESLSCLHAIEHFGLGRYGDIIDPDGWRKALMSIQKVVKRGGVLYLSVPVSRENRVRFNAHREFEIHEIPNALKPYCELKKFVYIQDAKIIEVDVKKDFESYKLNQDYLCGCYIFEKR